MKSTFCVAGVEMYQHPISQSMAFESLFKPATLLLLRSRLLLRPYHALVGLRWLNSSFELQSDKQMEG